MKYVAIIGIAAILLAFGLSTISTRRLIIAQLWFGIHPVIYVGSTKARITRQLTAETFLVDASQKVADQ